MRALTIPQTHAERGCVLALDVGKKRIGLAITDGLRLTAQPIPTFQRGRIRDDLSELTRLIRERGVSRILVGRPLHLSGDESRQSEYTREFGDWLAQAAGIPVTYWDERWTTVEANRLMRDAGASLEARKRAVDQLAAMLLLSSYLEAHQADETPGDD